MIPLIGEMSEGQKGLGKAVPSRPTVAVKFYIIPCRRHTFPLALDARPFWTGRPLRHPLQKTARRDVAPYATKKSTPKGAFFTLLQKEVRHSLALANNLRRLGFPLCLPFCEGLPLRELQNSYNILHGRRNFQYHLPLQLPFQEV